MRTNIDIDEKLIVAAMKATGLNTKKATVEEALRRIIQEDRRKRALENLAGIGWEGGLDEMREGWTFDPE